MISNPKILPNFHWAQLTWDDEGPFSTQVQDYYASRQGRAGEFDWIYSGGNNLVERFHQLDSKDKAFHIGEIGFGMGANFLYTLNVWFNQIAIKPTTLHYYSCERAPIKPDDLSRYWSKSELQKDLVSDATSKMTAPLAPGWNTFSMQQGLQRAVCHLWIGDAIDMMANLQSTKTHMHAWYLDGFSPSKNQSAWEPKLCQLIASCSYPEATFSTFSSAKSVGLALEQAGFRCQRSKGYAGKRYHWSGKLSSERAQQTSIATKKHLNSVVVVGAGVMGSVLVERLLALGVHVHWVDPLLKSMLPFAVIHPQLSAHASEINQQRLRAWGESYRALRLMPSFTPSSVLHTLVSKKAINRGRRLLSWDMLQPFLRRINNADDKFIELAFDYCGYLNPRQLRSELLLHQNLTLHRDTWKTVKEQSWIGDHQQILYCSPYALTSKQSHALNLSKQFTINLRQAIKLNVKKPVHASASITPSIGTYSLCPDSDFQYWIGSSDYDPRQVSNHPLKQIGKALLTEKGFETSEDNNIQDTLSETLFTGEKLSTPQGQPILQEIPSHLSSHSEIPSYLLTGLGSRGVIHAQGLTSQWLETAALDFLY